MKKTSGEKSDTFQEEMRKAVHRIGTRPTSAINWLLDFMQKDLPSLSEGQRTDLASEVSAFARGKVPFESGKTVASRVGPSAGMSRWDTPVKDPFGKHKVEQRLYPNRAVITQLQSTLKDVTDEYFNVSHEMHFPSIELKFCVSDAQFFDMGVSPTEAKKRAVLGAYAPRAKDLFYYYSALLLAEYAPRITHCAVCKRLFVGERSDRYFCSSKCLNRATQQRFRKRRKPS